MLLQVSGIAKLYGATPILSNISLQVQERERIGLVGVNGAGKSTLLKIIAGELSHDAGEIRKAKETKIGYLEQNGALNSNRSIWDELKQVFAGVLDIERELRELEARMAETGIQAAANAGADAGLGNVQGATVDAASHAGADANADTRPANESADPGLRPASAADEHEAIMNRYARLLEAFREQGGYEIEANIRGVLHGMGFADFAHETPVSALSGGQKTRLALAKLLLQEPDLLMLDEPTNHLDIPTLTWLEGYLRSYPGAILVVSHDRYFLDALVGAIYEIERTSAKRYTGNYSRFIELKAANYDIELKHYERQQEEIARMEDFVQRNIARATTTKRAQSRRKSLERMERLDKPQGDLRRAAFSFEVERKTGEEVLNTQSLAASYPGKPELFRSATFRLTRGETAALIGPNGVGKSTLLKVLTGARPADRGTFQWGANVRIGYYDQEQGGLNPANTVLNEVWNAFPDLEEVRIRTVLGGFLFHGEDVLKKISSLSGGEKARVSLAKLMLEKANVLILDEPTNHLDLYSKEVLEAALIDYEGTLLFISHDRYFLNKMAERILELSPDGVANFLGNYDDYVDKKIELAELAAERNASAEPVNAKVGGEGDKGNDYEAAKQVRREERGKQRRTEQLEKDIASLEEEISGLEERLALPEVFQDYVKLQEINGLIEQKKAELAQAYGEWEALLS